MSGKVAAIGSDVTRWHVGDEVCALVNGGGYAEYCLAREALTLPIPHGFDLPLAAALPETLLTVWLNVFMLGRLRAGEWLLVHGGSSGIGTMAIQLAKLEGARAVVTAGSRQKCDVCLKLGADAAIDYRQQDFVAEVERVTDGHGADVILDLVGGAYAQRNLDALALDGRLVHLSSGDRTPFCVSIDAVMAKRAVITGSRLRGSELSLKREIVQQVRDRVWPHLGTRVTPLIDTVMPLANAAAAHAHMESSAHIGKILLDATH